VWKPGTGLLVWGELPRSLNMVRGDGASYDPVRNQWDHAEMAARPRPGTTGAVWIGKKANDDLGVEWSGECERPTRRYYQREWAGGTDPPCDGPATRAESTPFACAYHPRRRRPPLGQSQASGCELTSTPICAHRAGSSLIRRTEGGIRIADIFVTSWRSSNAAGRSQPAALLAGASAPALSWPSQAPTRNPEATMLEHSCSA